MVQIQDMEGRYFMLDNSGEAIYMSGLESYQAMKLYDILKDQQPERFYRMKAEGELVPYLNGITIPYKEMVTELVTTGTHYLIAEQIAWTDLAERVGL